MSAEILCINQCPVWIKFFVDDVPSGAIPPADHQGTFAEVGKHTLRAETIEDDVHTAITTIELGPEGCSWTVTRE